MTQGISPDLIIMPFKVKNEFEEATFVICDVCHADLPSLRENNFEPAGHSLTDCLKSIVATMREFGVE